MQKIKKSDVCADPDNSNHIRVSNSLSSHIIVRYIAGPGQFKNRPLMISADVKGKGSMILLKIKETAHFNRPRVVLRFGVYSKK